MSGVDIDRLLFRFFKGSATTGGERKLLQWIDSDPENTTRFMRARRVYDMLKLSDRKAAPRGSSLARRLTLAATRAAAVVALAACFGYWFSSRSERHLASLTNDLVVPAGQRANVTLPDGTNVWLNSMSELTYPAVFTGGERSVSLSGEAFFDVARDEENPFTIRIGNRDVTVLGTRFNVSAMGGEDDFSLSVLEGSVRVGGRDGRQDDVVATGGQEVYGSDGRLMVRDFSDTNPFLWREGLLCFRSATLGELLRRFEYSYGVDVVFDPSTLPNALFSGKFRISDGIFHALDVLRRDVPFDYRRDELNNVVYVE